jgi:outer membrane PBP1 activator LpoA protein
MEDILKTMQQHYQEWEQNPQRQASGYEYEKTFTQMWQQLGKTVFQQSVGQVRQDKNAKKNFRPIGEK